MKTMLLMMSDTTRWWSVLWDTICSTCCSSFVEAKGMNLQKLCQVHFVARRRSGEYCASIENGTTGDLGVIIIFIIIIIVVIMVVIIHFIRVAIAIVVVVKREAMKSRDICCGQRQQSTRIRHRCIYKLMI